MHSSDTAQSLLALPAEVTQPDPYRVFGLAAGESDAVVISQAIRKTIARLNAAKPHSDPAAWQQAAAWVTRARGVLLGAAQKPPLDQATAQPGVQAVQDPLLGLLPGDGNAVGAAPAAAPTAFRAGPGRALPPSPLGAANSPAAPAAASEPPAIDPFGINPPLPPSLAAQLAAAPAQRTGTSVAGPAQADSAVGAVPLPIQVAKPAASPARRRRRRTPWAAVTLGLLTLVSFGGIAVLLYVLNRNPGGIVINLQSATTDGGHVPATDNSPPAVRPPRPPADPVMGGLTTVPPRPTRRDRASAEQLAAADNWLASLANQGDDEMSPSAGMPLSTDTGFEPPPTMVEMEPTTEPAMVESAMAMEPIPSAVGETSNPVTPLPDGDADAAEQAIGQARRAIAAADWQSMESLAEAAEQAAVTKEQKIRTSRLLQLAELASYYHGGLERGLESLNAAESFAVTEQIQVVVVEIGTDKVIVKFNGRNKEYPRRELPLVLAHKIALFAMPADAPETIAASHAYQAVAPISTPQYRQQAIRALEAMTEPVEGANPVDVAAAIRDVFTE